MQRRSLLKLGAASAIVLAALGAGAALMQPALAGGKLSAQGRQVFGAVAGAVLEGSLPVQPALRQAAIGALMDRIEVLAANLAPHAQVELSQLLSVLASVPGRRILAGLDAAWHDATTAQVQQALQAMRISSLALRRQAYQALHDIVGSAYFADAGTWALLGYPGPLKI